MQLISWIIVIFASLEFTNAGGILPDESMFIAEVLTKNYTKFFDLTRELITSNGYPFEAHTITTDGGYILQFFRIPHGIVNQSSIVRRPPLVLLHGHGGSSDDFVFNTTTSYGYRLADSGFDVWLLNNRGNKYCLKHTDPQLSHHDFYQFNFDEMAKYDTPVQVDYILQKTGYNQLQVIANSMGSTVFFCLLASKPEYNQKIKQLHTLPAVVLLNNESPILVLLASLVNVFELIAKLFDLVEFPASDPFSWLIMNYCDSWLKPLCDALLNEFPKIIETIDPSQVNMDGPPGRDTGGPIYHAFHFFQIINSHQFQYYDYDPITNVIKYGQITPAVYNLSKVTTAVYLYYSEDDELINYENMFELKAILPNVKGFNKAPTPNYTHFDFLGGDDKKFPLMELFLANLDKY